jgi:hypothetical protein
MGAKIISVGEDIRLEPAVDGWDVDNERIEAYPRVGDLPEPSRMRGADRKSITPHSQYSCPLNSKQARLDDGRANASRGRR